MRAVVVTTSYPRFDDDAAGRFVQASVQGLRATGVAVEVLAPDHPLARRDDVTWLRHAPRRRWQTLCFGHGIPPNLRRAPWRAALAPPLLAAMVAALWRRRHTPTVAHWLVPGGLAAALAGVETGVAIAHGSDVALLERAPGGLALARWIAARGHRVIAVSHELARRLRRLVPALDVEVLPPAVDRIDRAPAPPARCALGLAPRAPVVLFLGRLVESKGLRTLFEALPALPAGAVLLVGGDGPLRSWLAGQAARAGREVRVLGPVPPSQRGRLFGAADLLVLPSQPDAHGHAEGCPAVLLEAMAAGLPVVASAVGGIPEHLVDGESGLLVPPADAAVLGLALRRVLDDATLRERLAAAARLAVQPLLGPAHGARLRALLEAPPGSPP